MASILLHKFVERIKGQFGDIVVKKLRGRMFIARPPDRSNVPPPTAAQQAVRDRFVLATAYAKGALRNPLDRAFYEHVAATQDRSVFTVASGDFLTAPTVGLIELSAYMGQPGDKVTILATDDVGVASIHVVIRASDGTVIEQGPASNVDGPWIYVATTAVPTGQSVTFEVTAKDRPGNEGRLTKGHTIA